MWSFIDMFMYNSNVHHYNTRQSHLSHIPAVGSNLGKRNSRYEGPVIWNELQSSINTLPAKNLEYSENTMEILAFDILVYCKLLGTNHK